MTLQDVLTQIHTTPSGAKHAHTGEWIASTLRDRIASGHLGPGMKLPEEDLCDALGVSRNTLREAFTALASERIISRIPNRGVFVAQPMAEDVREIYGVRRYVEPAALRWSTTSDFSALREAVESAQQARAAGSANDMGTANQNFHAAVVALAGSPRLSSMMAPVLAEMRLVFHAMAFDPKFHAPYIAENAHVVDLLERGKRSESAELMRTYLDSAEKELLAVMKQA